MYIDYSQFVYYDESSPSGLRWKVDVRSGRSYTKVLTKAGDVAGTKENGYWHCQISKKRVYNHRVIWVLHGNTDTTIDHINGDRLDDRIENLRDVTQARNQRNRKHGNINSSSKLIGVSWNKSSAKWRAQISVGKKTIHIGLYKTEQEAHAAYLAAKTTHHLCTA